jgi:parvulin-like peptidyl-prolyl isomerase
MPRNILLCLVLVLFYMPAYAENAVVAKVNGTPLTQKELDAEVDKLIPQITFHRSVSPEKRNQYFGRALEAMIVRELQYQDALAKGLKTDPAKVEENFRKLRKKFKTEKEFKAALEKDGLTEEKLRSMIAKELLVQAVVAQVVTGPSKAEEKELKEYYDRNLEKFKQPESVKLRLITVKDEKKAHDIVSMLKKGDDFGEVAYGLSEDAYRMKSGDIGYVHKGRMLPELDAVAFTLKTGEVSEPVFAENNWYIVKVEDRRPRQQLTFDKTKTKLRKEIEGERQSTLMKNWVDGLKTKSKIEVLIETQ